MIKVLAIDDEPLALQQLSSYIQRTPFLELCGQCLSTQDARRTLQRETVDAIFCDISMPDGNGLDFVRSLGNPPIVVFTTAYSDYAIDGYKVNALDYLLKPFGFDEFEQAADKVRRQYNLLHPTAEADGSSPPAPQESQLAADDNIFLKVDHRIVRISVADIRYVEGMSEYLKIHLRHEAHPIVALLSMKRLEERLPSTHFMRIHRSYIVNLQDVTELNRNRVFIGPDTSLPIGDLYKEPLRQYVEAKFLGK